MPRFKVRIPFETMYVIEVEAECESEAYDLAVDGIDESHRVWDDMMVEEDIKITEVPPSRTQPLTNTINAKIKMLEGSVLVNKFEVKE